VFQRCCRMIESNLLAHATGLKMPNGDPYDKDFMVCALDLISGLCEGLEGNFGTLAAGSNLLQLVHQCLSDDPSVRQSALALMGDMSSNSPEFIAPAIPDLLPLVVNNLAQWEHRKVCSNAAWAFGELITSMGDEVVSQQVEPALTRLVTILNSEDVHPNVMVNVTITMGKLGRISTDRVAPTFHTFAESMCLAVAEISDTYEKDLAFQGLCMIAQRNPAPLSECAHQFVIAVVSWADLDPSVPESPLKDMLQAILTAFHQQMVAQGTTPSEFYSARLEPHQCAYLTQNYYV